MRKLKDLTTGEFKDILSQYFAPPEKRSKMSNKEITELAAQLNQRIDIPIINETGEEKILIKIILKIDRFLYDNLPNEFYNLIRSVDKGIDKNEAKRLIKRLSKLANRKINIPYLPEPFEYFAIRFIIGIIINSSRKDWDIIEAKKNADSMNIPTYKNASDKKLEKILI